MKLIEMLKSFARILAKSTSTEKAEENLIKMYEEALLVIPNHFKSVRKTDLTAQDRALVKLVLRTLRNRSYAFVNQVLSQSSSTSTSSSNFLFS